VKNGIVVITAAALVVAGCSSGTPPFKAAPGVLPPGTAEVTIDGRHADTNGAVQCAPVGSSTTITAGDESSGATVMVSEGKRLTVEFVRIRNLNGFTGDYNLGLEGDAAVALTRSTYLVTGTALGFNPKSIKPTTHPFTIQVAC
jgi:lipoprotein LpqH